MAHQSNEQFDEIKALLVEQEAQLTTRLALERQSIRQETDTFHAEGPHDHGEESSEEQIEDNTKAVIAHLQIELHEVHSALQRLESGEFGQCYDCREAIPLARLRAAPASHRCVQCQEQRNNSEAKIH